MKILFVLFFALLSLVSCRKEETIFVPQSVRLHGTYFVESESATWVWKFAQNATCGGELHTFADANNTCGLYFYSQCGDTLICAAGNLSQQVYRGDTWFLGDTIYYDIGSEILKLYKQK